MAVRKLPVYSAAQPYRLLKQNPSRDSRSPEGIAAPMSVRRSFTARGLGAFFAACLFVATPAANSQESSEREIAENTGLKAGGVPLSLPLFFEANRGQSDSRVRFLARGNGYTLFVTPTELVFAEGKNSATLRGRGLAGSMESNLAMPAPLRMKLLNGNPASLTGAEELPGKVNYLIGKDPSQWHTGVPLFSRVRAEEIYPGVDLIFHGDQKQLEYDFVVAPGADPSKIKFRITGASRMEIDARGDLVLHTPGSDFRMHKPSIYQMIASKPRPIEGSFLKKGKQEVSFQIGPYDRTQTLVIDPSISYASFLGGSGIDEGNDLVLDTSIPGSPKIYVPGETTNITTFPETSTLSGVSGGAFYSFLAKVDPTLPGSASLVYLTFLGGSLSSTAGVPCTTVHGHMDLDLSETGVGVEPVLSGNTSCVDFPVTAGSLTSGGTDNYLTRLMPSGAALDVSVLFGGNGIQGGAWVSVDGSGNVLLASDTSSTNLPTTPGAYAATMNNGAAGYEDCFVAEFDRTYTVTKYLTYMNTGAGSTDTTTASGCGAIFGPSGKILAGGNTADPSAFANAPSGTEGFQATFQGTADTFAVALDPTKSGVNQLAYWTFFGGGAITNGTYGATPLGGGVFAIVGATTSNATTNPPDIPVNNCLQNTNSAAATTNKGTGFLVVIDANQFGAASLICGTYFGGSSGGDQIHSVGFDPVGGSSSYRILLGGQTTSTDFPTSFPVQSSLAASQNAFVSVLNVPVVPGPSTGPPFASLAFSTYIGGGATASGEGESVQGLAADSNHNIYARARTLSANFFGNTTPPTTVNGFQTTCTSCGTSTPVDDVAIFEISSLPGATLQSIAVTPAIASITNGSTQQFTATGTYSDGSIQNLTTTATWSSANLSVATIAAGGLATASGPGTTTVTATFGNIDGTAVLTVAAPTLSSIAVTPNPASVAQSQTIQFTATGTYSDGSKAVLTNATWSSGNTSVATISSTGLATGVSTGSSGISATVGNIVGSTTLTVTSAAPTLVSVTVSPATPSVAVGGIVQFIAIGNYSNGTTQNLTATVVWTTSSASTATISNISTTAGQANGVAAGPATITATSGAISGSTVLTVTSTPANLYVGSVSTANCCLDAVNTSTNAVVKSIPVTTFNEPLGVTPDQTRIYVADYTNNLIDVVDATTNTLVTTIPVGPGATAVAITPNGQFGYVAEYGDNNVSVFSVATNAFTQSIPVGFSTDWIEVTPDGSLVYAASAIDGRVAVISAKTNTLTSTITLTALAGQGGTGCVSGPTFSPTGTVGYFLQGCQTTGAGSMTALSIPGNTEIASVAIGTIPYESAITPDGTKLYVVNAGSNTVSVISTASNTVTSTIPVGTAPQSVIVSLDGTTAYVASTKSELINLIQTSTDTLEATTIPMTAPFGFAIASPPAASAATVLTLTPPNLIFGSHVNGTASTAQSITVTNPGTKPVTLTSIALTGPSAGDFTLTNGCGTTLGAGGSCTLQSTFVPATTGSLTALVTITNTNGLASYTQSAPLSGMGTGSTVSTFSGLTASQGITVGAASITLAGVIGNGTTFPAPGEVVQVTIDGITHGAAIGAGGGFTLTFATNTIPASGSPYPITYNFAGDATFTGATDSSTTLTVNPVVIPTYTLSVTDIGTGNGTVVDNTGAINCVTTAGVQSGTCSASYASGTGVTLTATPVSPSTFGGWGGACSGASACVVTMTVAQSVTASFTPPPQQISLTFNPGVASTGMATYDCPGNPSPSPTNPCTAPNAHAVALTIGQVITPFTLTVQATEVPPSMDNGICPSGGTPATNFACRFVTYFTYQTTANGEVVPLCVPYANGNCVHYQVFSGTPGTEPNPADYVGPVDWQVTWNNGTFVPPAPYTGSTPRLYDDPDYAVSVTSPYGSNCTTPMLVGNPPAPTNPPIFCQFEFDITTAYLPGKGVDPGITGRTKQLNDVVVAFPPANVGNLTVTEKPVATPVTPGSPIGFTITITDSAGGAVTGATLTDNLPAGTNVNWAISPAYTGPGTCAIVGVVGSQVLSCAFGTINASQSFTIGVASANSSIGTYTDTATIVVGAQQILSIGTLSVQGASAFSGLTPSQSITVGTASISLAGVIGSGTSDPAAGETVTITINGTPQSATIGSNGAFAATFSTATIPASATPYTIMYSYAGDLNFAAVTDTSTTLTVNPVVVSNVTLTLTDIGTGNGTVTDSLGLITCVTTAGVQSGTCSASYASGTGVTLTATPVSPSTFGGWGGACSGASACVVTMTVAQSVTASFTPPPQQISLTFNPGVASTGMATYDCPGNPSPSPTNPCTAPNAHAVALTIGQVITPFTLTVQATEVPPSMDNGICPSGGTPATNFACRFVTYFTYQTTANGEVVPLCVPYANGNCVHYQVFSGTPGTEPNPADYVGPVDWQVTWNNGTFVPPAPYTGSTPRLYDDPDYAVSVTSPYGSNCTTPMLVGNPPAPTNPPIFCQFEFDITTAYLPGKGVDPGITGRTKQLNDVVVAFPPANVGNLTVTEKPVATPVTPGSPIGFTITITDSAGGAVTGATLTDNLPAGTNVNWAISPAYTGPGTCAIAGVVGSQVLSCAFGTINASQSFTIGVASANSSIGTYTDTATIVVGAQQILSIGTLSVQGASAFSGLTPSQSITVGTASISLAGVIGSGTSDPAAGETVTITINGTPQSATIGSNGAFAATFSTATIPASAMPYTITYSYAGDLNFAAVTDTSTTLTVNPSASSTLVISPSSVDFGQVPLGRYSFKTVMLSNSGTTAIHISKVAMSRTGTGDYADYSVIDRCPKSLAAGNSCTLIAVYAPEREEKVPAYSSTSILITDSATGSPQSVPVKAQNINPKPRLSSNLLFFGYQEVGTISRPQTITLTNDGTTPLNLSGISIVGDFALASPTACNVGTSLTPRQSCTLVVEFRPTKQGLRGGLLTITDNALMNQSFVFLGGIGK